MNDYGAADRQSRTWAIAVVSIALISCASTRTPLRHSRTRVTPVATRSGSIHFLPFSSERGPLVPLRRVKLAMKREALEKLNRRANEMLVSVAQSASVHGGFGTVLVQ